MEARSCKVENASMKLSSRRQHLEAKNWNIELGTGNHKIQIVENWKLDNGNLAANANGSGNTYLVN